MQPLLKIITQTTLLVALVIVLVGGVCIIPPKLSQWRRLEAQRNELLGIVNYKNSEIKILKEKQQRFKTDPEFVELIARQNKRVFAGEYVFVRENESATWKRSTAPAER